MSKPKKNMSIDWGLFLGLDKILLPLRGFPSESDAATLALRLAESAGARIMILHVTPNKQDLSDGFLNLQKRIEETAERINVPVTSVIQTNKSPKHEIVNQIRKTNPDLTIMTTRHEKGFPTIITGSNTSFVVKQSSHPLLIIRSLLGDFDSYREMEFERLMVLIQKGDLIDDNVVKLAIGIASKPSTWADLIGLHVVSISDKVPLSEFQEDIEFQQQEKSFLHNVGQYSQHFGIVLRPKVVLGRSLDGSVTYAARNENADLLLMAVREKITSWLPWRRGLAHTSMYQIAKNAPCTVAFYFAKK